VAIWYILWVAIWYILWVAIWYICGWPFVIFCGWPFGIFCGWPFGIFCWWPFGIFCGWPFGIFCGLLVYFVVIWYILWSFEKLFPFWYVVPRKIWQPWLASQRVFLCMYVLETQFYESFTKVLRKFYESFTKVLRKFSGKIKQKLAKAIMKLTLRIIFVLETRSATKYFRK
jgi:hypothetical protein